MEESETRLSKKILLIEDDASFRNILEKLLEKSGYNVIPCESAIEALKVIKNTIPDVIVSDYNLEGFDNGVDLGRGIRQSMKLDIPVIIISGIGKNRSSAQANSFYFLKKPFKFQELNQAIRKGLQIARKEVIEP